LEFFLGLIQFPILMIFVEFTFSLEILKDVYNHLDHNLAKMLHNEALP